ncbi:ornithine carbamoyltransferase [Legionella shakespearei]|uniref:Ornithine carbamoyltransferase n=1 Tax=Legionella shakespearei DSM 23087 TaxID=1122169 RepID=A0A0W0Z7T3_9GAMM|nr:ornithine carbamoyltransferase [Legionella shakespearei]KTD65156.1 ornithine carbamoyltransferase [Legionella shakespearei DSM 23087]
MTFSTLPNKDQDDDHVAINEVTKNTFVINLQQAMLGVETTPECINGDTHNHSKDKNQTRHFITGTEFSKKEIKAILNKAKSVKRNPGLYSQALLNKSLVMIFEKPSFRTRLSFSFAIQSMGGLVVESISPTRKQETPEDMARVLNGYADFVMVRTHADNFLHEMASCLKVPLINGLSALHHPCQILADCLSLEEHYGDLQGLKLAYIGDGNNILHSLMLLAPQLGITIHYCCPKENQPNEHIVAQTKKNIQEPMIHCFDNPEEAVKNVDAVYTDVWTSMGFKNSQADRIFKDFQVNEALMSHAKPNAVFMHCMPMERGKEVSETLPDSAASIIFTQSENRMHVQKALLLFLQQHGEK